MSEVSYSQDQVDELKRQWEHQTFEVTTKEVLTHINKRLDESNNYKATIGKDVKDIRTRLEQIETARKLEQEKLVRDTKDAQVWHQNWWVRVGISSAVIFQLLNFLINIGVLK